jgi:hypothetical protein
MSQYATASRTAPYNCDLGAFPVATFSQDLGPKRLELLREFLSPGDTVAVLQRAVDDVQLIASSGESVGGLAPRL